jgi:hypothetical protein
MFTVRLRRPASDASMTMGRFCGDAHLWNHNPRSAGPPRLADGGRRQQVVMESTGVFWKPIYNIPEDHFQIFLVNARHIKNVPGRKTDVKDCDWIAQLLQCGLVRGSFISPKPQRELRDLPRQERERQQAQERRCEIGQPLASLHHDTSRLGIVS